MDNRHFIARRAARYFHSGDVVNLGIGIPSLCGNYAESGVLFQTENGFIGVGATAQGIEISDRLFNAGGIPYLPALGGCAFDVAKSFGIIRSGR
ncbi:MAG: succinyl-CoA--3-ketoacid-CoA transferase, partial [Oscillibacter sp.]|nr:succinyl-CoA--3-ketoacid-CoA transferase [Oscillibacter sp.]